MFGKIKSYLILLMVAVALLINAIQVLAQSQTPTAFDLRVMTSHKAYFPLVMNSVPEIDIPSCRWSHTRGQIRYITYKWGNRLQSPGSLWRNAFESGLSDWNNAPTQIIFYYSSTSDNVINTYDDDYPNRGYTIFTCVGSETKSVTILGNIYWDIEDNYTDNQRLGIASHEVGHGQSIGHIPNDNPHLALMFKAPPLSFFSTIYTPQSTDIEFVNQTYR